jgi:hypothetical protein
MIEARPRIGKLSQVRRQRGRSRDSSRVRLHVTTAQPTRTRYFGDAEGLCSVSLPTLSATQPLVREPVSQANRKTETKQPTTSNRIKRNR